MALDVGVFYNEAPFSSHIILAVSDNTYLGHMLEAVCEKNTILDQYVAICRIWRKMCTVGQKVNCKLLPVSE